MFEINYLKSPKYLEPERTTPTYNDGYLVIEYENYHVSCGGKTIKLGRAEFLIISFLAQHNNKYVSMEAIWDYLWHGKKKLNPVSLRVLIYRIRQKFTPLGIHIETMINFGYKLATQKDDGNNR